MGKCDAEKRYENKLAILEGDPIPWPDLGDKGKKELGILRIAHRKGLKM